jgi:periplasmic mercuric ion binding protein
MNYECKANQSINQSINISSMKNIKLISIILLVASILFVSNTVGYGQDKKSVEIKIKTSAVCNMCKDRIEQGLAYEKGIKDVSLDVETKVATIRYNPKKTSPEEIRKAISKLGYDADEVPADKVAYEKLPPCCKKDAPKHD